MKKRRKKYNIANKLISKKAVPYLLLLFVVSLSIAYSAFGTELNIGKFISDVRIERDIRITGVRVGNSPCKYTKDGDGYQTVTCGTESFYVIPNDPDAHPTATADTVTLLAKYNLDVGRIYDGSTFTPIPNPTGIQNPKAIGYSANGYPYYGVIAFSQTAYWGSVADATFVYDSRSSLYTHIENYKIYLESLGVEVKEASLASRKQYNEFTHYKNFNFTSFWLGYARELVDDDKYRVYHFRSDGDYGGYPHFSSEYNGVRPVIIVPKSVFDTTTTSATSTYIDYNVTSISSGVNLPNKDSSITYNVEITNIEAAEMGLLEITGLPDNLEYEIGDYKLKDKICNGNGKCNLGISKEIELTIKYKEGRYDSNNTSFNLNLNFNFQPFYKIKYTDVFEPKEYNVGDVITYGSESFYVIDSDETTITALAAYNITLSETDPTQDPEDIMSSTKNPIMFSQEAYWASGTYSPAGDSQYNYVYDDTSNLYQYVEAYKGILEEMGASVIDAKLLSFEEAISLGCSEDDADCFSAPSWVFSSTYWIGSASGDDVLWYVNSDGDYSNIAFYNNTNIGIRPVITFNRNNKKTSDFPLEAIASATFELDLGKNVPSDLTIKIDGATITDYTYENGMLTIPNVSGDIEITNNKACRLTNDVDGDYKVDLGDEITCGTGEEAQSFYAIPNDSGAHPTATGSNLTFITKYNLDVGGIYDGTSVIPIENPTGIQIPKAIGYANAIPRYGVIAFSGSKYWGSAADGTFMYNDQSLLYPHVENYKTYMIENLGVDVKEASLASINQFSRFTPDSNINSTSFWFGTIADSGKVYYVYRNSSISNYTYAMGSYLGIRPVIIIPPSNIFNVIDHEVEESEITYTGTIYRETTESLNIGDDINLVAYETDLSNISRHSYLKHDVVNNKVTTSYACLTYTENEIRKDVCLRGVNSSYYESNKEVLRSIESYINTLPQGAQYGYCAYDRESSDGGKYSVCYSDPIKVYAYSNGSASSGAPTIDGSSCYINSNGFSRCYENGE